MTARCPLSAPAVLSNILAQPKRSTTDDPGAFWGATRHTQRRFPVITGDDSTVAPRALSTAYASRRDTIRQFEGCRLRQAPDPIVNQSVKRFAEVLKPFADEIGLTITGQNLHKKIVSFV
jgi:hypothetical protein